MQIGKLNKRIALQSLTVGKDASGGMTKTWTDVVTCWASVRNLSGNERSATSQAGGQVAEARTEFMIRYRAGVTTSMRVSFGGAYYNIRHVNNVNARNEVVILTCDTGVNNG